MGTYEDNLHTRTQMFLAFASTYTGGVVLAIVLLKIAHHVRAELPWWLESFALQVAALLAFIVFGLWFNKNIVHGLGCTVACLALWLSGILVVSRLGFWTSVAASPLVVPLFLVVARLVIVAMKARVRLQKTT